MSNINEEKLRLLAESILFENNINEMFQPDDDGKKYPSYSMYDRPADKISGDNTYQSFEDSLELPLAPSDMMANHITINTLRADTLEDKNYVPKNTIELLKAINTIVKNKDLSQKQIAKFWNIAKKSLETA
jgi:hypothetical protein